MVAFLFGAGAEVGFNLCGGENFAKSVLGINSNEINEAIKDFYSDKLESLKNNRWYPYQYYSTAWKLDDLLKASVKKKFLTTKSFERKKEYDDLLSKEVSELKKSDEETQNIFIGQYTSYMGIIDEYFHTLISPVQLGPKKFWDVINCYTRAYLTIVSDILYDKKPTSEEYIKLLKDPKETYKRVIDKCDSLCGVSSYYSIVKSHFKDNEFGTITTNYTPLCTMLTGCTNTAYIHGKINLFESPYENKVYDVTDERFEYPKDIIFPYLFIQSGIKPVIDQCQLNEYSKMLKILDETQILIIVGYRLNPDDNHINSLIRSFITDNRKNNKVIFFDFNGEKKNTLTEELRLSEHPRNLEVIEINKYNCLSEFERVIKKIKQTNKTDEEK